MFFTELLGISISVNTVVEIGLEHEVQSQEHEHQQVVSDVLSHPLVVIMYFRMVTYGY